jgi:hypothetical protein
LALHHLLGTLNIIRTESENLSALFEVIIQQVFQLTQLSCAGASPMATVHNQDDVLPTVLR